MESEGRAGGGRLPPSISVYNSGSKQEEGDGGGYRLPDLTVLFAGSGGGSVAGGLSFSLFGASLSGGLLSLFASPRV